MNSSSESYKSEIIRAEEVSYCYHSESVLANANFSIYSNEFIGVIGPNGGGKSTLIKLIVGILTPSSGCFIYPNPGIFSRKSNIGYLTQNTNLNAEFPITALEVVEMSFLKNSLFSVKIGKQSRLEAMKSMDNLGILDLAGRKIGDLSGGQRQKVLIARAICSNPSLLILDEPMSNVDSKSRDEIYKLLIKLNKCCTVMVVNHDISAVIKYSTRILHVNREVISHSVPDINFDSAGHMCEIDILHGVSSSIKQQL